jgi:putative addiction module component (TIGR02574 family)
MLVEHKQVALESMSTFEEILSVALSLSPGERAMLADHLLGSLDGPGQKRIDALWAEEAERRLREIDEGKVETIDGELVMQRLRSRRKQRMT